MQPPPVTCTRDPRRRLSFSHQKAYADWVAEAKRSETRTRRSASVERLLAGRKEPGG
jgi:uncharacterized protein YdeI (YjbR/CyaY-like superfamily)